jgi:hypothetical protein
MMSGVVAELLRLPPNVEGTVHILGAAAPHLVAGDDGTYGVPDHCHRVMAPLALAGRALAG